MNPNNGVTVGADGFKKAILPALKYYNPALEINVDNSPKSPTILTLHFHCEDPEKLRNIAQPGKSASANPVDSSASPDYRDKSAPRPSAANDEVVPKEVPANSDLPQTLYQRSVTLALRGKRTYEISRWFKMRTNARRIETSPEDQQYGIDLKKRRAEVEEERARSKVIQEAIDREKRMLEQAKKIAETNANEAAV